MRTCSLYICLALCWLFSSKLVFSAERYLVETIAEYEALASDLSAGDTIVLKNGVWRDFEILFKGVGTERAPISLTAQTKGQVILSGQSNLRLAGEYLEVSGLVFKDGYTPSSAVIEYRQDEDNLAFHSRVTEVVIDNFNNPDKQESDYWVAMYGQFNRFDHNHLVGKRNKGVTLAVRLGGENSQQNYHSIDHNYFGYRPVFGSNGGETLRIGTSHYSLSDSFTQVRNNYFDRTDGEVEIISVKSGGNTLKGNVFFESRGTLTLRHGNNNLVEENIFFGNGKDHTGGIRVINKGQIIRNNYLQGLTGYRFGSGLTVMNGVPNSSINRYHQVDKALIENNTLLNVDHIQFAAGSDKERSAVPINSRFRANLIVNANNNQSITAFDDISGITFSDNLTNVAPPKDIRAGFKLQELSMAPASNGLYYPEGMVKAGIAQGLKVIDKQATGVSWYPKVSNQISFGSGRTVQVSANADALVAAITAANPGDTLLLESGEYDVAKLLKIDKTITIQAKQQHQALLKFQRSALFELHDGGNLTLDGLRVSGVNSPDAYANSVIRTKKWGMTHNYHLIVKNSRFDDLDINHSFHFFMTGKGAFADRIELINNQFNDVSGDILQLNAEIEDLGIYNAEYVTLRDNEFNHIRGAVLKLYRGGTDESTFGPHLSMVNNKLKQVGKGKRNKHQASVFLHGVQVSDISDNIFEHSAPLIVDHTVGEPQTQIRNNEFNQTVVPSIVERYAGGQHTAVLENNQFTVSTKEHKE